MENITSKGTIFGTLIAQAGPKGDTGKTGNRGLTGEAGYSPIKGVDYFTQEDISEIRKGIEGDLTGEYNKNAIEKTNIFNTNAKETTTSFDLNAENKTKEYNDNALAEIDKYNSNAIEKSNNFDTNFENKTSKFDSNCDEKTKEFNDNNDLGIQNYNNNAKKQMEIFDTNFTEKLEAFNNNAGNKFNGFNTNSADKLLEYNTNHTNKMKEFNDNFNTKTDTFNTNAKSKLDAYNKNDTDKVNAYNANDTAKTKAYNNNTVAKEKSYNDNATSKTETFDSNATNKQKEFDDNANDKLAEYNQNAEELINKVEQVQIENESLKAENKLIKEQIPSSNVSGNSVHIEDSGTLDFDWKINGGHKQESREGYQLLESYDFTDTTINNLSCAIKEDGKIVLNGTPSKEVDIVIKKETTYKKGTYTFVINQLPTNAVVSIFNSGWEILSQLSTSRLKGTFTLQKDAVVRIHIYIRVASGNLSNYILEPILYEGEYDENKTYEQYGVSPSPDYPSEIETVGSNVNKFDKTAIAENTYINGGAGSDYGNVGKTQITNVSDYMSVKKGKQYIFHYNYNQLLNSANRGYAFFDEDKNVIVSNSSTLYTPSFKKLIITPAQDGFVRIAYDKNCIDIKFEEGTVATPYSPYRNGQCRNRCSK